MSHPLIDLLDDFSRHSKPVGPMFVPTILAAYVTVIGLAVYGLLCLIGIA